MLERSLFLIFLSILSSTSYGRDYPRDGKEHIEYTSYILAACDRFSPRGIRELIPEIKPHNPERKLYFEENDPIFKDPILLLKNNLKKMGKLLKIIHQYFTFNLNNGIILLEYLLFNEENSKYNQIKCLEIYKKGEEKVQSSLSQMKIRPYSFKAHTNNLRSEFEKQIRRKITKGFMTFSFFLQGLIVNNIEYEFSDILGNQLYGYMMNQVGYYYFNVEKKLKLAAIYFEKSAECGNFFGKINYAKQLIDGGGTKADPQKGIQIYEKIISQIKTQKININSKLQKQILDEYYTIILPLYEIIKKKQCSSSQDNLHSILAKDTKGLSYSNISSSSPQLSFFNDQEAFIEIK